MSAGDKTMEPDMEREEKPGDVLYGVEDVPSPLLMFLFGLQQAIMTIGSTLSIPFIIAGLICAEDRPDVTSSLLSVALFMCGIATLLQSIFGVRQVNFISPGLGIIQGGSHTFVGPIVAMMTVSKWKCPEKDVGNNSTSLDDEVWEVRMREIQGNLAMASVTQVLIGCTGFVGILLKFVGPLTIAPTIALIGLSLTEVAIGFNKIHWGIACFSMVLTLACTLYLRTIELPFPTWNRKRKCHFKGYPVFQLFPVIISIGVSWLFCYVLTATDVLPTNSTLPAYKARTDARLDVLERAPWFYWPYPFQFGTPTVSAGGYVAFLAATLSSIIESMGDYFAAARISGAPPPPPHAVNRGIAIEGLASIVSGLVGSGHGTTSYSSNIGAIGITKVASRTVFMTAGVMLVLFGVIGKFGAVITLIPDPVIGGNLTVVFGVLTAVGLSSLQFADMSSTRNLTIVGISMILGLMVPQYVNAKENVDAIQTGSEELDQMIKVLLGTAMFVGGSVGCFLDNTVPGTPEERGILSWRVDEAAQTSSYNQVSTMYDLPLVTNCCKQIKCCSSVPLSPSFNKEITVRRPACCRRNGKMEDSDKHAYVNQADVTDIELNVSAANGTHM